MYLPPQPHHLQTTIPQHSCKLEIQASTFSNPPPKLSPRIKPKITS